MRRFAGGCGVLLALCLLSSAGLAGAATRYDPRLRFRTIETPHFLIHFHQGGDALAQRLAVIAEEIHADLAAFLPPQSRARTHVIVVDQTDLANGWATPFPYNTIEVTAAWPAGDDLIGNTDDWLRLVLAHEYMHILHLDRSRGLPGLARRLFGRAPWVFPNLALPLWQIEGIATYKESAHTGLGRVPAGDFLQIPLQAARAGRFEPLDRVGGGLIDWPSGGGAYAYGAYFHQYLANRFGEASLARLAEATAGWLPYTGTRAFRRVFGASLGQLWRDFGEEMAARALHDEAATAAAGARRLTRHGFIVSGPRFDPHAPGRLVYSVRNPHRFPALFSVGLDGAEPRPVVERFLGTGAGLGPDRLYFEQIEVVRNVGLQSDLYVIGRDGGRARRLTRGARVADVDLSPDGRTLACVAFLSDRRVLATIDVTAPGAPAVVPLISEAGTYFATPRWSPDGRFLAAERRRLHGASDLVVVDVATGRARVIAGGGATRRATPAWTPDGGSVLFAAAPQGRSFDLYAADVNTGTLARVTDLATDARSPDVSPDGRTIVYVGYTPEGFDLFTLPLDRRAWQGLEGDFAGLTASATMTGQAAGAAGALSAPPGAGEQATPPRPVSGYSPWRSLAPTFWLPVAAYDGEEWKAGGAVGGLDALGRHAYGISAVWATQGERIDWTAGYAYDRWLPTVFVAASDESQPWSGGRRIDRTLDLGAALPLRQVRRAHLLFGALRAERQTLSGPGGLVRAQATRNALRLGWAFNNARLYGYSISPVDGLAAGAGSEHVREALGADGNADALAGQVRGYQRLGPRHAVLAVRVASGTSRGDAQVRRRFAVGGPGPAGGLIGFGGEDLALLRGFRSGEVAGRHLFVVNADYRLPLWRIERGRGTWPLFLRTLHGAVFADAGDAWDDRFSVATLKRGAGVELSLDAVVGYYAPLTFTVGAAWAHDPTGRRRDGVTVYGRVGRGF